MAKEPTYFDSGKLELLLSILVAIALGFSIEKLAEIDETFMWFVFSLITIIIAIFLIYELLEVPPLTSKMAAKLGVIATVTFFPFTLARTVQSSSQASSGFSWGPFAEMIYAIFIGVFFIWWGIAEKDKPERKKLKYVLAGFIILGAIGLYATSCYLRRST